MKASTYLALVVVLATAACSSADTTTTTTTPTTAFTTTAATPVPSTAPPAGIPEDACPTQGDEFASAKLYIEHNATDEDTGVHGLFGGEAWSVLCLWDPNGELILFVDPLSQFNDLTISDLFFESREPPTDEYSVDDLRADFPEGEYAVAGVDFSGVDRFDSASFTHDIPTEPEITTPELAEDEETGDRVVVPTDGLIVSWEPVTESIFGDSLVVTGYEVIITKVEHDDPNGISRPTYDVHVPPSMLSLTVPDDFLEPGTLYELEVLAIERSGNQTISVGFFTTQ